MPPAAIDEAAAYRLGKITAGFPAVFFGLLIFDLISDKPPPA